MVFLDSEDQETGGNSIGLAEHLLQKVDLLKEENASLKLLIQTMEASHQSELAGLKELLLRITEEITQLKMKEPRNV